MGWCSVLFLILGPGPSFNDAVLSWIGSSLGDYPLLLLVMRVLLRFSRLGWGVPLVTRGAPLIWRGPFLMRGVMVMAVCSWVFFLFWGCRRSLGGAPLGCVSLFQVGASFILSCWYAGLGVCRWGSLLRFSGAGARLFFIFLVFVVLCLWPMRRSWRAFLGCNLCGIFIFRPCFCAWLCGFFSWMAAMISPFRVASARLFFFFAPASGPLDVFLLAFLLLITRFSPPCSISFSEGVSLRAT